MQNPFFKFLAELATRIFSKNPKFFDIVQMIALVVGGVSGLVQYLQSTGVELPKLFEVVGNINVVVSSVVALILAQLPNDTSSTDAK
jgi:hypothetical protein